MSSDTASDRIQRAARFLQAAARVSQQALGQSGRDTWAAHGRRILSDAAWALLDGTAASESLEEAQHLSDEALAGSNTPSAVSALFSAACGLLSQLPAGQAGTKATLYQCVVRPLGEAAIASPDSGQVAGGDDWSRLASDISAALDPHDPDPRLLEALAGLLRLFPAASASYAVDTPTVRLSYNGPYLLGGKVQLTDYLGRILDARRPTALCRCGRSQAKPYCDGSHVTAEFTGAKDPRRVPDQRDVYEGQTATIYDNRGLCAHSGFCTDRLNSVFHVGQEPFVTPSGGRFDEILRAVRKCPSGALSIGMDGREMRDHVDQRREATVEISRNGPYRITGGITLLDERNAPPARPQGASLEHYSLCRCGASLNKPFCSGMHWSVNFTDPVRDPAAEPSLFEWAGGYPALLDMTTIFYSKYVPQDPLISPLFANMSPDHPQRVAAWLSEVFGGPKLYSEHYGGYGRMISQHVGKNISLEQRARWAALMAQSADDAGLPADPEFRAAFLAYIEWGSRIAVENSGKGAQPPPNMPVPRWWWVCEARPGARPSALASTDENADSSAWVAPQPGQRLDFDAHIKPLFRPMDRNSMKFAFDLWSQADVATHGAAILGRLKAGTMPCDGAWPKEKVEVFERWLVGSRL